MLEKIRLDRSNNTDLNMYQCGIEDCSPGHSWGPAVRDHYLIHYVLYGKGSFTMNGVTYELSKGDGFLICPNTAAYYKADEAEPWTYSWVGFYGLKAESYLKKAGLKLSSPIFHYNRDNSIEEILHGMISANSVVKSRDFQMLGLLYQFFAKIIEISSDNPDIKDNRLELYVKKALEYIEINYYRKITIEEMSKLLGLNRSYLCSIFKSLTGMSPQEYIISYRMDKACELMLNDSLSLGDIARSIGYDDPLLFSKIFKKKKNISPKAFRISLTKKKEGQSAFLQKLD